jgi:hypothetical protein
MVEDSKTLRLGVSKSESLLFSSSPSLQVSQSPSLPVSQSPSLPVSQSPSLQVSPSPSLKPMPFDPAWPQNGQNIDADRFRAQFAGIIDLIGSGTGINAAQVDSTNTLPPSSPANASVSVVGNTLHFTFEIPQGQEGPMGQPGQPFAQAVVDGVNTVNPGDPAAVGVSFDGTNVRFTFNIPRGNDGASGSNGSDGQAGAQGPPGEVSQAQLDTAIAGTSANTNAVNTLDTPFADPDMEAMRQKMNEMILNGRR